MTQFQGYVHATAKGHKMVQSMTGFASGQGANHQFQWVWDVRSVNAKGLDIRTRVPDWISGLEADVKARLAKAILRGSVSVSLRVNRVEGGGSTAINAANLQAALSALAEVEKAALEQGVSVTPCTPADILNMRGVMDQSADNGDTDALKATVTADLDGIIAEFVAMRGAEGRALETVLSGQINQIEALVASAKEVVETRRDDMEAAYRASLQRVVENVEGLSADRIAQEIALIAVKADVKEELDRLDAHVEAARKLLAEKVKIGRKLDFLSQEFNREANTLCSKSQNKHLTHIGLELKAVIDQMREQVQNVE